QSMADHHQSEPRAGWDGCFPEHARLLSAGPADSVRSLSIVTYRPKIACVATIVHKYSHAQHFIDRFLEGYGWNGRHHRPPMDLVSLYVHQVKENDLSRDRAARFPGMALYPTVADALTLGGSNLAVDGVLLIGEHGDYPRNEKGQTLYPRYELFREITA